MTKPLGIVDDKHVPLYRVVWVSDVPHFCGEDGCTVEGRYEVRLDQEESLFANRDDRDRILEALNAWLGDSQSGESF